MGTRRGVKADDDCVKGGKALYEEIVQIEPSVLYLKVFSSNPVGSNSCYFKWIINYLTLNRYPRATFGLMKTLK